MAQNISVRSIFNPFFAESTVQYVIWRFEYKIFLCFPPYDPAHVNYYFCHHSLRKIPCLVCPLKCGNYYKVVLRIRIFILNDVWELPSFQSLAVKSKFEVIFHK